MTFGPYLAISLKQRKTHVGPIVYSYYRALIGSHVYISNHIISDASE